MREIKKSRVSAGQLALELVLGLFAAICVVPVVLIAIISFSTEESIASKGFSFFPEAWTLRAYAYVFKFGGQVVNSYLVTIYETVVGTLLTILLTSMFAFALSQKDFKLRRGLSVYLLITMLINGGMLSTYIIYTNYYHMTNNLLVLVLPSAVSAFNCIVMRSFIQSTVPQELIEAAKIDGANEFKCFFLIAFPLMKPVLAAIGFMAAVDHWNQWQTAYLYISNQRLATLQMMLIQIEKSLNYLKTHLTNLTPAQLVELSNQPGQSARMAILICTILPIMVVYPFFQKYFIKGMTLGSVKG